MRMLVHCRLICGATLVLAILVSLSGCSQDSAVKEMEEQNIALIKRIHSEVSKGNLGIFDEALSPDYVRHCQAMPPGLQEIRDTAVFKAFVSDFVNAVSNCKYKHPDWERAVRLPAEYPLRSNCTPRCHAACRANLRPDIPALRSTAGSD